MSVKKPGAKGSQFEKDVCKAFSLWITNNKRDDIFYKTSGSGGRATHRQKQNKTTAFSAGDMSFNDILGRRLIEYFLVEIKRGYNNKMKVMSLIDKTIKGEPSIVKWFKKGEVERKQNNRRATIIIFRRDYCKTVIALKEQTYIELENIVGPYTDYGISNVITLHLDSTQGFTIVMIPLEGFFEWISPDEFRRAYKAWKKTKGWKQPT